MDGDINAAFHRDHQRRGLNLDTPQIHCILSYPFQTHGQILLRSIKNYVTTKNDQDEWVPFPPLVFGAVALRGPYHDSSMEGYRSVARMSLGWTQGLIDTHLAGIVGIRPILQRDGVDEMLQAQLGHLEADVCYAGHLEVDVYFVGHLEADVCFADPQVVHSGWQSILAQYSVDNYSRLENTRSDLKLRDVKNPVEAEEIQNSMILLLRLQGEVCQVTWVGVT